MYHTGSYIADGSILHRLDARIKLASVVGLSIIVLTGKPLSVIFFGVSLLLLVLICRISLQIVGQAVRPLFFFIGLIFVVHALFTEGDSLFTLPYIGLSLSLEGMRQGFFVSGRFLCLVVAAVLLTITTQPSRIVAALRFYLQPLKLLRVPTDNIAVMVMLALRLMPVLLAEKERIEIARMARGYDVRKLTVYLRIRSFLQLTTRILWSALKQADELAEAMEARNYQPGPRTSVVELKLTTFDFVALSFLVIFLVIFIALNSSFG
jgi:energy-coupling factor transport system permease protein